MDIKDFPVRLSNLRTEKGISARQMSRDLGLNCSYINKIECGKSFPRMEIFFAICSYLEISPLEFFDTNSKAPHKLQDIITDLKKLNTNQLGLVSSVVKELTK